jgi:hypothetical protein
MTAAYFEDHPTDPEKVILRKPSLDQGADYERGFVDGMQYQMQSSVDKAVNVMAQPKQEPEWVGLTDDEQQQAYEQWQNEGWGVFYRAIEAKLKERNT